MVNKLLPAVRRYLVILFKCECGAPFPVPAEAAGQTGTCPACGKPCQAPAQSDPDCVLVYKSGWPETGQVITTDALSALVAQGELKAYDLIIHGDEWRPLGDIFEMPEVASVAADEGAGPEIAVNFAELPPIPGHVSLKKSRLRNAWKALVLWQQRQREVKHKPIWQRVCYYLLVLGVLVVGYYAGLGKIINYALGRPCYVIVFNPDDSNYQAKLGRETLPLIANAQVTFQDIYVAATKKGKLTISSEQAPDQIVYNIAVPLSPGLDVAVNPNGKIEFGVYDFRGMTDKSLDAKARQTLISDIVRLRPPIYSSIVLGRLKNMAEEHFQGKKTDPLFTSQQYNFNRMSLSRSVDYTERRKDKKEKPEVFRPTLVKLTPMSFQFKGSSVEYNPAQPEVITGQVFVNMRELNTYTKNKFTAFRPQAALTSADAKKTIADNKLVCGEAKGTTQLRISQNDKRLQLTFDRAIPATVSANGRQHQGNWSFIATLPRDKDQWSWKWTFAGAWNPPKPARGKPAPSKKLTVIIEQANKLTVTEK